MLCNESFFWTGDISRPYNAKCMVEKDWHTNDGKLFRRFEFADFAEALAFVDKVGALAETHNHHPDISFGWGYAEITLFTHSEQTVTEKDRQLAGYIDRL